MEVPWMAVLSRIMRSDVDDTTRTLARILYEVFGECNDPKIGEIADAYARELMGHLTDGR